MSGVAALLPEMKRKLVEEKLKKEAEQKAEKRSLPD